MLKSISSRSLKNVGGRYALVVSKYNKKHTDALLRFARQELEAGGAEAIQVVRVPGAYEVSVVAGELARRTENPFDAILCLAVIFQGETCHAQLIADSTSHALAHLQTATGIPVLHGVALFDDLEQAQVRCLDPEHSRGREVARTALEMAQVMRRVRRL